MLKKWIYQPYNIILFLDTQQKSYEYETLRDLNHDFVLLANFSEVIWLNN